MQTNKLADVFSNCNTFMKLSRLDVCRSTRLHHSFLLKYNNNKYLGHVNTHDNLLLATYEYTWLVAWHSGRTSVSDRRTFAVLRSTCG